MGVQVRFSLLPPSGSLKLFLSCRPDRWDNLPDTARVQPGLYSNLMSFSVGPRVSSISHSIIDAHLISYPCSPVSECDSRSSKSRFSSTLLSPISPSMMLGLISSRRMCASSSCSISRKIISHTLSSTIKCFHASIHQGQVRGRKPVTFARCSLR